MVSDGSIESVEKSTYSSSVEDNNSYDGYDNSTLASGFNYQTSKFPKSNDFVFSQPFNLAYKNEGFKENSTFTGSSNYQSRAESVQEETPIVHSNTRGDMSSFYPPSEYYNTDTLPLKSTKSDSNFDQDNFLKEKKQFYTGHDKIFDLPAPPEPPPRRPAPPIQDGSRHFSPDYNTVGLTSPSLYRPASSDTLETNINEQKPKPKTRSKSEVLLETSFEYIPETMYTPISEYNRSKSQPLETAM